MCRGDSGGEARVVGLESKRVVTADGARQAALPVPGSKPATSADAVQAVPLPWIANGSEPMAIHGAYGTVPYRVEATDAGIDAKGTRAVPGWV